MEGIAHDATRDLIKTGSVVPVQGRYIPRNQARRVGGAVPWATGRWVQALRGGCLAGGWQMHELPKHPNSVPLSGLVRLSHSLRKAEGASVQERADLPVSTRLEAPANRADEESRRTGRQFEQRRRFCRRR